MEEKLSDLTKRFLTALSNNGISGYKLKADGVINNEATLTKIKQGLQQPSAKTLERFINKYGIDRVWLLAGVGDGVAINENTLPDGAVNMERGVPYYDVDFIGGFDLVFNAQNAHPEYYIDHPIYNKADCWCNVSGHSMEPVISHGDTIALKRVEGWSDFLPFGEIYAIVTDEHRTIKRVTRSDRGDDFFTLVPENKADEYRAQDIPKRLITHVFKVLGAVKRF